MLDIQALRIRRDGNEIAVPNPVFQTPEGSLWNKMDGSSAHGPFNRPHPPEVHFIFQRRIEIRICRHEADDLRQRPAPDFGCYVSYDALSLVIADPIGKVMKPGGVALQPALSVTDLPE